MRIYFDSLAHPKRLSKRLSKAANIKLSLAQETVARMFGYTDWHELGAVTDRGKHTPSKPDRYCSNAVVKTRRGFQMNALFDQIANEVPGPVDFGNLLMNLRPTDSYGTRDVIEAERICDFIFPTPQIFEWRPESKLLMTLEVAGAADIREVSQTNGATEDFSDRTLRTLKWFHPVQNGTDEIKQKPFGVAVCSVVPIIEENIILSVEVRFHSLSLVSDSARCMGFASNLMYSFLNSPLLLPTAKDDVSGAEEGITVVLSGDIQTVRGSKFLTKYLIPLLENEAMENAMSGHIWEGHIWDEEQSKNLPIRELKTDLFFMKT